MKHDISPEERLLRLIKNPKKQNTQWQAAQKEIVPAVADSKPALRQTIFSSAQKYLSLVYIQKIVAVVFIIAGIYFIFSFIRPWLGTKDDLASITPTKVTDTEIVLQKKEVKPYEYYIEGLKNRQIFASSTGSETKPGIIPPAGANADLIKDMNLLGIISGEDPEAVIEDKKGGKTYHVTKGDSIGEFLVEDIVEGKVILNYHDQRYELYL